MINDYTKKQQELYGKALRRMKRASDRGTGCHITADMIRAMETTLMGEWWGAVDDDGSSLL